MNVELKERTFGELLGLSFRLCVAHFGKLFFISAFLGVPLFLVGMVAGHVEASGEDPELVELLAMLGSFFVALLLQPIQQGASILVVSGSFTGQQLSLAKCLMIALRRLWPILAFSLAVGLLIFLGLLLVVPALMFVTWYYVGAPALVVENISWRQAMERSKYLSEGHRWAILRFAFVVGILVGFVSKFVEAVLGAFMEPGILTEVVRYFAQQIIALFTLVGPVAYYFHLRVVKESFDVETLSSLVDAIAVRHQGTEPEEATS